MTKIHTSINISAAHIVHTTKTKCSNLHGHTWKFEIDIDGDIREDGMVMDFIEIKKLVSDLDHKTIIPNEFIPEEMSKADDNIQFSVGDKDYRLPISDCLILPIPVITAECLAEYFAEKFSQIVYAKEVKVRVWESENSYAEAVRCQ